MFVPWFLPVPMRWCSNNWLEMFLLFCFCVRKPRRYGVMGFSCVQISRETKNYFYGKVRLNTNIRKGTEMDKTRNYKSRQKQQFNRSMSTENRGKVYRNVVCFPSTLALDVHEGFENGILTEDTNIIAVEKVRTRRPAMVRQLKKRTSNFQVAKSDAFRLKLAKYLKGEKVDYMPFDICGNFTAQLAGWFFRNQPHFANGMRMSLTLAAINRKKKVTDLIKEIAGDSIFKYVHKALKNALWSSVGGFLITEEMRENIATQVFLFLCSMPDKHIEVNSISLYSNKGKKKGKFTDMVAIDADVYDSPFRNKYRMGVASKVFHLYNEDACDASKVVYADKIPKVKKVRVKKSDMPLTTADKQKMLVAEIIESGVNNKGVAWITSGKKAALTRYCNKLGKDPVKVTSSIRSWIRMKSGYKGIINR